MNFRSSKLSMSHMSLALAITLLVFSSTAFAQCTIDAWSTSTGSPLPRGESTEPQGKKYEQSCGLTIDVDGELPSFVTTTAPAGEPAFYVRFYLLAEALSISSGDVTVLTARNDGTTEVELRLRDSGGINQLVAFYRTNNGLTEHPDPISLEDVWTAVEVSWSAGASNDGTFALRINDFPKYDLSNLVNTDAVINEVDLGVVNSASATGEVVFDAFDLRRTSSPELLVINEMFGISTRADVRTADEIVIGGFLILGDTDKCVVVRGRALTEAELPQGEVALADPTLVLYDGVEVIGSNNDWQDSEQAATMSGLGLEPPLDTDAAIYACLEPGGYTAHLTGVDNGTGLGIVEVFDADEGTPYLWGISTRSAVDTLDLRAIGGFIIDGEESKDVVVRGRGPSVGVPEGVIRLSDPYITLYSGVTPIGTNDDWESAENSDQIPPAYYDQIDAKDAMIFTNLAPGAYTVILEGVGGETGVAIVEVFDVSGSSVAAQ